MIYFIGYLVKGEAQRYHHKICSELANKFGIKYLPATIPSHLTLKAPFETNNIKSVEEKIENFLIDTKKTKLKLNGIGHFGKNVIFIDAKPSKEMIDTHKKLISKLKEIKGLQWKELENKGFQFHLTVATKGIKLKFDEMWKYLTNLNPSYNLEFDNIAILKYENGKWIVYKEYEIESYLK